MLAAGAQEQTKPKVDKKEQDLGEKLVRKALGESEGDVMAEIIRLSATAARKLDVEFDAGEETQGIQREIVDLLDHAIKQAAENRRKSRRNSSSSQSDRRSMSPDQSGRPGAQGDAVLDDSVSGQRSDAAAIPGKPKEAQLPSGALEEGRRGWGLLPARDRDEMLQGKGEGILERYRKVIEKYYRALQGIEDKR